MDRGATFRIAFDRRVFPQDVHRGNVYVASGSRSAFLSPRFDPVDRVLILENVGGPLAGPVRYRLGVSGLRDLDLFEMSEEVVITFDTGPDVLVDPPPPAPGFVDVAPILQRCAADGCHGGEAPMLGLDLSSGAGIRATAIGVAAEETRVGVEGALPWHGAAIFGGLARIDVVGGVGRPASSYLLYKVLGDPHIGGERMPPEPEPALSHAELVLLSEWIRAGAPTD